MRAKQQRASDDIKVYSRKCKPPFRIRTAVQRLRKIVHAFPKAALFQLANEGYNSVFEQLVACIISIRTRDETMLLLARRLFARAHTPVQMARLSPPQIDEFLHASSFHGA